MKTLDKLLRELSKADLTQVCNYCNVDAGRYAEIHFDRVNLKLYYTYRDTLYVKLASIIAKQGYSTVKMYMLRAAQAKARAEKQARLERERERKQAVRTYKAKHPRHKEESAIARIFRKNYRLSDNCDGVTVIFNKNIKSVAVLVDTRADYTKANQCRSYKYSETYYTYTINIPYKYHACEIGGLLTFYKGSFKRAGMPVEWIEQGQGYTFREVHGYLVKGEHIVASSLTEAQEINAKHRAKRLQTLLQLRANNVARAERLKGMYCTFEDSIQAGNCKPGTEQFIAKVEAETGSRPERLALTELDRYGKRYGLTRYTNRVIDYCLSKS